MGGTMLNLLFVDDEEFTREGIMNNLQQNYIKVNNIKVAENGKEALEIAKDFHPNILLSDIKMPVMDGIELGFRIRELYPDCKIIFMSGYTDKEYLKSAIDLHVYQYIEKPVVLSELNEMIREVASLCLVEQEQRLSEKKVEVVLNNTFPLMERELAIELTKQKLSNDNIQNKLDLLQLTHLYHSPMLTLIIKISPNVADEQNVYEMENHVTNCLSDTGMGAICALKNDNFYIVHLYYKDKKNAQLNDECINKFCSCLIKKWKHPNSLIIAVGQKVDCISNVYDSYKTAILAIEKSFFTGYGMTVFRPFDNNLAYKFSEDIKEDFRKSLVNKRKDEAINIIENLTQNIKKYPGTLVNTVKNFYYQLILIISEQKINQDLFDSEQKEFLILY